MGADGHLKLFNGEGVDAGAVTVDFVLVGVAVRLGTGCDTGALGMVGIP